MVTMKACLPLLLSLVMICAACTREPLLDTVAYEPKLVIDGWIEQGSFPRVILTSSKSYYSSIDSTTIRDLVETTAKVTVSDGHNSEILTLKRDETYFPPFIYEGTEIKGEVGKSYTLTVELRGEQYTATTTIPNPAVLEQLWYEEVSGKEGRGYIYGRFTDDPDTENHYRIFTQRRGVDKRFIPVYLSAVGDQFFNGKSFTFSILRGPESFTDIEDDLFFTEGDTVRIKFCTMDKAHFDFWRTLERELYVVGNPFSSSGNDVISNIQGDKALGVWGGYGVNYYQVIARE